MADGVTAGLEPLRAAGYPMIIALQEDMAKALGQAIAFQLNDRDGLICLDQLHLHAGAYLDIGAPVAEGQVIPVVIKTLVLS